MLGILKHDPQNTTETATSFGLKTLVFGTRERAYIQAIDHTGNLCGFLPKGELTALEYISIPAPYVPQIGDPHLRGFVTDPKKPNSIIVMGWDVMAGHVLNSYPDLRAELLRDRTAGCCLADFILKDVRQYQTADPSAPRLLERFQFEADRLQMDFDCYFNKSRQMPTPSRDTQITPKVGDDNTPQV